MYFYLIDMQAVFDPASVASQVRTFQVPQPILPASGPKPSVKVYLLIIYGIHMTNQRVIVLLLLPFASIIVSVV